jgi:hypothetical protein
MTGPDLRPFTSSGVTFEEAAANLSTLSCPTGHANTVPVDAVVTGERVATLCLDCDRQLPADWRSVADEVEKRERGHRETHHGHEQVFLLACRLCAEECA